MTLNRRAAAKPGYGFITGCQQGIDDQRNIRLGEFFSQRTIAGRHHDNENSVRLTPLRQMADDDGSAAQAQLMRNQNKIASRPFSGRISCTEHVDLAWRIGPEPIPHVFSVIRIATDKRRPSTQEKNGRFIRRCLRLGPDRNVAVMGQGGEWSINAAQAGFPNFKTKIEIGMRNWGVNLVESAETYEVIATDSQGRGRQRRNG